MRAVEKRIDYFERAKRLVEIPKLKVHFEKQREQNMRWHKERQQEKQEKSKAEHERNLALKEVFSKCVKNQQEYAEALLSERRRVSLYMAIVHYCAFAHGGGVNRCTRRNWLSFTSDCKSKRRLFGKTKPCCM